MSDGVDIVGSGVLPLAIHNNTPYILMGRERDNGESTGTWCGFGGGIERGEDVTDNAIREFMEESMALIMSREDISNILLNNADNRLLTRYYLNVDKRYVEHVVLIPYDQYLPSLFDRLYKQFGRCAEILGKSCGDGQCNIIGVDIGKTCSPMFEKDRINWFPLSEVIEMATSQLSGKSTSVKLRPCFAKAISAAASLLYSVIS